MASAGLFSAFEFVYSTPPAVERRPGSLYRTTLKYAKGNAPRLCMPAIHGMAISNTQSSQVEFADWLGVIGTARRCGTRFSEK
jgi:hypothetical protein